MRNKNLFDEDNLINDMLSDFINYINNDALYFVEGKKEYQSDLKQLQKVGYMSSERLESEKGKMENVKE